jgi:hypothetical protein
MNALLILFSKFRGRRLEAVDTYPSIECCRPSPSDKPTSARKIKGRPCRPTRALPNRVDA